MIEIAIANFTTNDKDFAYVYDGLWQWHYGQVLRIQGLKLPTAVEIHFSLQETGGEAKIRIGTTKDGVTDVIIPDFIFEKESTSNYYAFAFVYLRDETSGQTVYKIKMQVKARPKPEAYSTADQSTMAAILATVTGIADGKADGLTYENSILKLMSGQTELARVTITGGSGGSGREIELQKGDTAIQWRYVGDEAWTDLVLLEEISGKKASIDDTLTLQGMAADAKVVGDELKRISSTIDNQQKEIKTKIDEKYQYKTLYMLSPNGTVYSVKISDDGKLYVDGVVPDEEVPEDLLSGRLLLWEDDFEGDSLNTDIWDYELGYVRNNEKQYYTADSKNSYVSDSILHIVALKDNPTDEFEWSSASIDSQLFANGTEGAVSGVQRSTGFSYGYGLIEVKARCNTPSQGVWPAFWSRGATQQSEGWPMCGEIDIGELFYNSTDSVHRFNPGMFWYDWHYLLQKSRHATDDGLITGNAIYKDVDTDWHYYGMERSETEMIFYFDREEFCRIDLTAHEDSDILSAMRQPMSVKFNLAMGSTGGEIEEGLERAEYDIDYVRYYAPSSVTEATDSGSWDFPSYMPTELAPNKIARIIPDRDMASGKNQYLYWESSDNTKVDATAGLIRTKTDASGEVTITMKDTFGNSKSATITIKEDANCISNEVREIPTNPTIVPYGEKAEIQVRLVPYWVTNHTVKAELETTIEGVTVSVAESSHTIAKYSTPCSIISIENNGTHAEDIIVNLVITALDSGKTLTLPLTIKATKVEFDTTGMYAAYLYENTVESSSGVGTISDSTGNNKDPLTNLYYTASYNNGICRVVGKGIQSQVQNGQFNPNTAEGFFLEEFNPEESRTFVFNIKSGMTEMRSQYLVNQSLLSIAHSGIGRYSTSNTVDGRHGASFGYVYSSNTEDSGLKNVVIYTGTTFNGRSLHEWNYVDNPINPDADCTTYLHNADIVITVVAVYNAVDNSMGLYQIIDDKLVSVAYNGFQYYASQNQYDKGTPTAFNTVIPSEILAESETDPFYWRYGNGNQICSDFVRAICVYDKVLTIDEMRDIAERLTAHYA